MTFILQTISVHVQSGFPSPQMRMRNYELNFNTVTAVIVRSKQCVINATSMVNVVVGSLCL